MSGSHIKAVKEIQSVAEAFPARVNNHTVTQACLWDTKKHRAYVSRIKETLCLCQTQKATIDDCQGTLDLPNEMVQRMASGNKVIHLSSVSLKEIKFSLGTSMTLVSHDLCFFLIICALFHSN